MISRFLQGLFCTLALCVAPCSADAFEQVFIFGDSLSDSGNLAEVPGYQWLKAAPYDNGFSDGPRAVQVLAEQMGLQANPSLHLSANTPVGTNYAVAGARARTEGSPDLSTQLAAFLAANQGAAPADSLYVLFIGGNDVRDARDASDWLLAQRIVREAARAVNDAVETLMTAGARSVLVVNAPDIGAAPETLLMAQAADDSGLPQRTTRLTNTFNRSLGAALKRTEKKWDLDLMLFDSFEFAHKVTADGQVLGFENTTDACFITATAAFNPDCLNAQGVADFDAFFYFDEFHPSGRSHERLARGLFALVPER